MDRTKQPSALVVGASRGLGLGLARELLARDWHVIATLRDEIQRTPLHDLAAEAGGRLEIETLDINRIDEIEALRGRLDGRGADVVFVSAGVTNNPRETIGEVSTDEFTRVLVTNALGPMRVIERLYSLVRPDGVIGVMSSELASIGRHRGTGWDVYRASKVSLNMLMHGFAARHPDAQWSLVAIAPGWVRTDMGGPSAPLDIETSMRGVADVLIARQGKRGFVYLNYLGETVPW
jgi:NAD(P)-dependent dehydrogenase (short-subunit alcohol dehydrogenase family)